ncbi:MAG: ferrous iron transport protein B [Robiginitomaculum sp.]|nr:ferrous iron transport protein B [Robiginitomaculum sp.]
MSDPMARELRLAMIGAPNTGKTTFFNGLTGGRAKTANYPGVTVERRTGHFRTPHDRAVELIDLPGIYGLAGRTLDERVAVDAITGRIEGEAPPDLLLIFLDATHLRTHLHSVLELKSLGRPAVLVLNMMDLAERDGTKIDIEALEKALGIPVIPSNAARKSGREALIRRIDDILDDALQNPGPGHIHISARELKSLQSEARAIANSVILHETGMNTLTRRLDNIFLHPLLGPIILASILFLMFQAVYSWANIPMDLIDGFFGFLHDQAKQIRPDWLSSLLADGIIAGIGSVLIFLPQILILFAFILLLESSGYMGRAAFLMDELMRRAGLNGRAFIPLLSSFACAVPGIMAARTIESERDRLTTIMVAPLMTCSARLPVYTLVIAAFIPREKVWIFNQQGLVIFTLYLSGILSALIVAFILRKTVTKGETQPLLMELPSYKLPQLWDFVLGLWQRIWIFLRRAGTVIFTAVVALWVLASFPRGENGIRDSFAGMVGRVLEPIFHPIGFNLETVIALVPGMAAREVVVAAMGTVYALQGNEEEIAGSLSQILQNAWTLPSALSFLAWYVFAPQCFATIAMVRRETNSLNWTLFMVGYLFALAYIAAFITYRVALAFTG